MSDSFFFPISSINIESIPVEFTYPFYYEPHSLSIIASLELQLYLENNQMSWNHNFGLTETKDLLSVGKMFGVLIVETTDKRVGYLRAYSGELINTDNAHGFVPAIFTDKPQSSLISEVEELTKKIDNLSIEIIHEKQKLSLLKSNHDAQIEEQKKIMKALKAIRDEKRVGLESSSLFFRELERESIEQKKILKEIKSRNNDQYNSLEIVLLNIQEKKSKLTEMRKNILNEYQLKKYGDVYVQNFKGEKKSLTEIFKDSPREKIPVGSGHCAAPKLLQYAYNNNLKPLAMAEFWWGKSPDAEIRAHKSFYPACNSRCKPILSFMLEGLKVEKNPLLENSGADKEIEILFEDDHILIVNKPPGLLSVPGKSITDSIQSRITKLYPNAIMVHRLDQETSGLMIIALNKKTLRSLQKQFVQKKIRKKYIAILEGCVLEKKGKINLPLRGDYDDLPRQIVCEDHGKEAATDYEVISIKRNRTRINFYPITGRTHQLRVHSAHERGLGIPIVGDTIYGSKDSRLFLHATQLTFIHPKSREEIVFTNEPEF